MKKLMYYVVEKESNLIDDYFDLKFKNSLLYRKGKEFYFHHKKFFKFERIDVSVSLVNFNEELVERLKLLLRKSYVMALTISEEPISQFDEKIFAPIYSAVQKYSLITCNSIFYFISELFYGYLMGHYLKNGNKRISFMFLINTLRFFGYHFHWSFGKEKNYSKYESVIVGWVCKFENVKDYDKCIQELYNWITSNIVIALEWR